MAERSALTSPFDATLEVETPEQVMLSYTLAGFGSRALAAILDTAIVACSSIALWILVSLLGTHLPLAAGVTHTAKSGEGAWALALIILFQFAIVWGYYVCFEGLNDGQTPGKRAFKLRVVRDGGFSVTFSASAVRNLARVIDAQPGLLYAVGAISVLTSKTGKRLGDILAGEQVNNLCIAAKRAGMQDQYTHRINGAEQFLSVRFLGSNWDQSVRQHLTNANSTVLQMCAGFLEEEEERISPDMLTETRNTVANLQVEADAS